MKMSDSSSLMVYYGDAELEAGVRFVLQQIRNSGHQLTIQDLNGMFPQPPSSESSSEELLAAAASTTESINALPEQSRQITQSSSGCGIQFRDNLRKVILEFRGTLDIYTDLVNQTDQISGAGLLQDIREQSSVTKILSSINQLLSEFQIEELKQAEFWILEGCSTITRLMKLKLQDELARETEDLVENFASVCLDDFEVFDSDGKKIVVACLTIFSQHFKSGNILVENIVGMIKLITSKLQQINETDEFLIKLFFDVNDLFTKVWNRFSESLVPLKAQEEPKSKRRSKPKSSETIRKQMSIQEAVKLEEKDVPGYLNTLKECMYGLSHLPTVRSALMEHYNKVLVFLETIKN